MIAAVADMGPDFSIYTGDVVAHDVWEVNRTEVQTSFNKTYSNLDTLGLVYSAVGNHDSAPVNLFPSEQIPNQYSNQWTYDALASDWSMLTSDASVSNADNYGSYSAVHAGGKLRVISYNSIFYYTLNFWAYTEPMAFDPNGQLAWLISELDAAEQSNQRVWLIAHIPSGNTDHLHEYSDYFDRIVNRYSGTISAMFFGHTHTDRFQLSYSDYHHRNADTATMMGYVTPSLTPTSGHPSFRVYSVDPETFGVLDYTEYIANISQPQFQKNPSWEKYYSAKEVYGGLVCPDIVDDSDAELTPAFWHNVTEVFEADQSVFDEWNARMTRGYNVEPCEGECREKQICRLRGGDAVYNCAEPSLPFKVKRDDGVVPMEEDDGGCEKTGLMVVMRKMIRAQQA